MISTSCKQPAALSNFKIESFVFLFLEIIQIFHLTPTLSQFCFTLKYTHLSSDWWIILIIPWNNDQFEKLLITTGILLTPFCQ